MAKQQHEGANPIAHSPITVLILGSLLASMLTHAR